MAGLPEFGISHTIGEASRSTVSAMRLAGNTAASSTFAFQALLVSGWFGLLAGLLEGISAALLIGVPGLAIRVSPQILWIAPAFNLILFLSMGAVIGSVSLLTRKEIPIGWVAGFFAAVAGLSLLLLTGKIHLIAALILSFGIGLQVTRHARKRQLNWANFVRRSGVALVVVVGLTGAVGALWGSVRERYVIATNHAQAKPNSPNVLLITLDTLRADHLSAYGYDRLTSPNLNQLAEQGVLFENAFANSSWTLPTHATLFTGRQPSEHKADWTQPLDKTFPTIAEILMRNGYLTVGFSANTAYVAPEWGLARGFSRFDTHDNSLVGEATTTVYGKKLAVTVLPRVGYFNIPGRKTASEVNHEFLSWLDRKEDKPFFAFLNYFDLHDPYLTSEPYRTRFSKNVTRGEFLNFQFQPTSFRRKPQLTPEEIQAEIDSYDGCLNYLDARLGELFAELRRRGLDQNTVVIVTSDHGESFGAHDLFGHGNSLYLETLHVPLILRWPGQIPAGKRVSNIVSLHNVGSTILELVGVTQQFPGKSLVTLWGNKEPESETELVIAQLTPGRFKDGPPNYPTTKGGLTSIVTDRWHLILSESGQAELYDWRQDVGETTNVAATPEGQKIVEELRQKL